MVIIAIIVAI